MRPLHILTFLLVLTPVLLFSQPQSLPSADFDQSWIPIGAGVDGTIVAATEFRGKLVALEHSATIQPPEGMTYRLIEWDGWSWKGLDTFSTRRPMHAMVEYDNELYIGGAFTSIDDIPGIAGIARWNGSEWRPVGGTLDRESSVINTMQVYRGELYCGGFFREIGNVTVNHIARWNGSRWADVGGGIGVLLSGWDPSITSLTLFHDELYAGGAFYRIGDAVAARSIARWDGSAWHPVGQGWNGQVTHVVIYRDSLFISARDEGNNIFERIVKWNGASWDILPRQPLMYITDIAAFGENLYISGSKDEQLSRSFGVCLWNGAEWGEIFGLDKEAEDLFSLHGELYLFGSFTQTSTGLTPLNRAAQRCSERTCGGVSGTVMHDRDGDCAMSDADVPLRGRVVEILPGPFYAMTDARGRYSHYLPFGAYTVRVLAEPLWGMTCNPSLSHDVTVGTPPAQTTGKDFSLTPLSNIEAARVGLVSGRARTGMSLEYVITYENTGTMPMNGTVRFFYDPRLTPVGSIPPATRQDRNTMEWDFFNLELGESRSIHVTLSVPMEVTRGEELCAAVEILPRPLDAGIDWRDTTCVEVTGAYDPNDISVAPIGIEENGEITRTDSVLTYIVRFQNTGNDTAFRVVVIDTISPHLSPASIRLLAASHPYTFSMKENGILTWTFDGIMLPDSGASELRSHGFFKYTLQQRPELPEGARIPNRASIYFDYNVPVMTNTVVSVINQPASVATPHRSATIELHPNPTTGKLLVRGEMLRGGIVSLCDMVGRSVMATVADGAELTLDLAALPDGVYLLTVPTPTGALTSKVFVTR